MPEGAEATKPYSPPIDPPLELPALLWSPATREDGSAAFWDPQPLIDLGATLVSVYYRPVRNGQWWGKVGMIPPRLLRETLASAAPELERCHDRGIKVLGYADMTLFHPEMLEADGIPTRDLYARSISGDIVSNTQWDEGGAFVACVNCPAWRELQVRVAEVTAESGFDGLQFDLYPFAVEPSYHCHCQVCRDGWSEYSTRSLGASLEQPGGRFGRLDFRRRPDRIYYEWRLKRFCELLKTVEDTLAEADPGFRVVMNHVAGNADFMYEAAAGALRPPSSETWTLRLGEDSTIPLHRFAEAASGDRLLVLYNDHAEISPDYRYRSAVAEAYASGGAGLHTNPSGPDPSVGKWAGRYYSFIRANERLLAGTESDAKVAFLYSWRNEAFIRRRLLEGPSTLREGAELRRAAEYLARLHVPFDCLMVDTGLDSAAMRRYDALVAWDLRLLDDGDAELLHTYLINGGRLLVVGDLGTRKEVDGEYIKRAPPLQRGWIKTKPTSQRGRPQVSIGSRGNGLVASIPMQDESPSGIPPLLAEAAARLDLTSRLNIEGGGDLVSTIRRSGQQRIIHVIRLGPTPAAGQDTLRINLEIPAGIEIEKVTVASPDVESGDLRFTWDVDDGRVRVELQPMRTWAVVNVGPESG